MAYQSPPVVNRSETIQIVDGKKYYFHAVIQGQTLYSISRTYGVSQEEIIKENPEIKHGLKYNQLIKIPVKNAIADKPQKVKNEAEYIEHRVKRRETLYGISRQYEVKQEMILEHNPEARKGLQVNQILKIPVRKETEKQAENYNYYIVNSGDTPYSISRAFNIPIDSLEIHNPGILSGIRVGQRIAVPIYDYLQKVQEDTQVIRDSVFEFEKAKYDDEFYDLSYCQNPSLKEQYNVALMIPLYLEELTEEEKESGRIAANHPSFEFIQFYEGILIALDSVKNNGININLLVYDVCQNPAKALKAINSEDFSKIDLIIGPFFSESIKQVGYYAERNNIALISPLYSNREQLNKYTNLFQVVPSLEIQLEYLSDFVSESFSEHNIILVHSDQRQVMPTINMFTQNLNARINRKQFIKDSINLGKLEPYFHSNTYVGERTSQFYLFNDSVITAHESDNRDTIMSTYLNRQNIKEFSLLRDTIGALILELDSTRENLVIGLVGGDIHVSNVLRQLHTYKDTFDITVVGIPQWRNLQSLEYRYMNSLRVHLFAHDYNDYSDHHVQYFVSAFRNRFFTEPNRDAFLAANIGVYFFNALGKYGKEFYKCVPLINKNDLGNNSLYFSKTMGENAGWENNNTTILRYHNYRIIDLQKKALDSLLEKSE